MAKKYSSTEILGKNKKPISARGIDGAKETVEIDKKQQSVASAIIDFVTAAGQEKAFKEKKDKAAETVRAFIGDVRDFFAKKKDFTKTYRVFGTETPELQYAVDVSSSDKFTGPTKLEDILALKKLLTAGVFNQIYDENTTISIKQTISDDDKKRRDLTKILLDVLGEEKVKENFEREVVYTIKSGLSEKIYEFPADVQEIIRKNLKAAADAVKDASEVKAVEAV